MSFNTIYYGAFNDNVNNDRIDIYIKQEDFTGEPSALLLDANPLVISYPSKEWDAQLFGSGCKINIINQTGNFYQYDSLFSIPEKSNYVEIIKTTLAGDSSMYIFQGYILPELYTSKLEKNIRLTISATDRLTTLDRYIPGILVDTSVYRSDEYVNSFELIADILKDPDITDKIWINNTLENVNYTKNASSCVFNNVMFQADNFVDKENIQDSKKCFEKILKSFCSRCYYSDNKWMIERIADLKTPNRRYATYNFIDGSISYHDVSNNKIDLSCPNHEVLSGSPELTYNPGYQKLVVNLKYKQPESLVENYFYDIHPLDSSRKSNGNYPMPGFREWMVSSPSLITYRNNWDGFFTAPNASLWTWPSEEIPGFDGMATMFMHGMWTSTAQGRAEWADDQTLTTMFQFSPPAGTYDQTVINVKYKVSTDIWQSGFSGSALQTRFALRGVDASGNDWWIGRINPSDTSTYWKSTVYTFDTSILWDDLKADNIGQSYLKWEISNEINITEALNSTIAYCSTPKYVTIYNGLGQEIQHKWVVSTVVNPLPAQKVGKLYLDVYMMERTIPGYPASWLNNFNPYYGYIGDFDVDIKTTLPNSYLEASMGYFYNTLTRELEIFDTSTVLLTNGLYNCDSSLILRSIGQWRDSSLYDYMKLQDKYIEDMAQMIDKPKYGFSVDIRSNDSSLFTLGQIYNHNALFDRDGSLIDFLCNGLDYNVKGNSYRLDLIEYKNDSDWRINAPKNLQVYHTFGSSSKLSEGSYFGSHSSSDNYYCPGISPYTTVDVSLKFTWLYENRDAVLAEDSSGYIKIKDAAYNTLYQKNWTKTTNASTSDSSTWWINLTDISANCWPLIINQYQYGGYATDPGFPSVTYKGRTRFTVSDVSVFYKSGVLATFIDPSDYIEYEMTVYPYLGFWSPI